VLHKQDCVITTVRVEKPFVLHKGLAVAQPVHDRLVATDMQRYPNLCHCLLQQGDACALCLLLFVPSFRL
jgi:hypothetical protein